MLLRQSLQAAGLRYRIHNSNLPGRPDIAIKKYRLAIFVDGEFWHGFDWEKRKPAIKSNRSFWLAKIERNMQRQVDTALEEIGYQIFRFWSKEVLKQPGCCVREILDYLENLGMPKFEDG